MRCFIGVPVPGALATRLTNEPIPPGARPVPAANLHLTLAFLGDREPGWVEDLCPALEQPLRRSRPFSILLATLAVFPRPGGLIWAAHGQTDTGLRRLHRRLWSVLEEHGVAPEDREFAPHVTLARGSAPLRQAPLPGPWVLPADRVMFYESPPEGRYRVLREWRLASGEGD